MRILTTIAELRAECERTRVAGGRVGLVPTMGYFHEGHLSLMHAARAETDLVVVTLFVNPLQFGAGEDLDAYPRDLEGDARAADSAGADILFAPHVDEMYPAGACTTVHVDGLTDGLCAAARPTHFDGVTTVVAKLFSIVGACRAYFGRKDAQQLAVIRRMTTDLDLPVDVVGCPLVRESDGLAMSSRNAYLTPQERTAATVLSRALRRAANTVRDGERDSEVLRRLIAEAVATEAMVELEYAEVRTTDGLEPLEHLEGEVLVAVAARVGAARLIDNMTVSLDGDPDPDADVRIDLGVTVDNPAGLVSSGQRF